MNLKQNIVSQQVTFKAVGARFACHGRVNRPGFETRPGRDRNLT